MEISQGSSQDLREGSNKNKIGNTKDNSNDDHNGNKEGSPKKDNMNPAKRQKTILEYVRAHIPNQGTEDGNYVCSPREQGKGEQMPEEKQETPNQGKKGQSTKGAKQWSPEVRQRQPEGGWQPLPI